MGQYKNGKWEPTFGDVQAGVSDWAPGEGHFHARPDCRIEELEAENKRLKSRGIEDMHHRIKALKAQIEAATILTKALVRQEDILCSNDLKPILAALEKSKE